MGNLKFYTQKNINVTDLIKNNVVEQFNNFFDAEISAKKNNAPVHLIYSLSENEKIENKEFYCFGVTIKLEEK